MRRSFLALLFTLGTLLGAGSSQGIAAGTAAARFVPFTGTAEIRYTRLPWYYLPTSAAGYAGEYDVQIRFTVRDPQHFRVDSQTVEPALESGLRTAVVSGRTALVYDVRTGIAARTTLPVAKRSPFPALYRVSLLSALLTSDAFAPGGPLPAGLGSARAYVRELRRTLFDRYPPEYGPSFAHVTGQTVVAGRPAVVVHYGPMEITDTITGCSFKHPGHCVHHYHRIGSAKVVIDRDHPFVLESHLYEPSDPHSLDLAGAASFQVTSITYGTGPSASDLAFVPPVPVARVRNLGTLFGGGGSGGSGAVSLPAPFAPFSQPTRLSTDEGYQTYAPGPTAKTTGVDFLFSDGRHTIVYAHPGDRYGFGLYLSGAYLYVQERLQVHGLPEALQTGSPATAGTCSVWTGTYSGGERWLAFARGPVSIQVVSNLLTRKQLIRYAAHQACA